MHTMGILPLVPRVFIGNKIGAMLLNSKFYQTGEVQDVPKVKEENYREKDLLLLVFKFYKSWIMFVKLFSRCCITLPV